MCRIWNRCPNINHHQKWTKKIRKGSAERLDLGEKQKEETISDAGVRIFQIPHWQSGRPGSLRFLLLFPIKTQTETFISDSGDTGGGGRAKTSCATGGAGPWCLVSWQGRCTSKQEVEQVSKWRFQQPANSLPHRGRWQAATSVWISTHYNVNNLSSGIFEHTLLEKWKKRMNKACGFVISSKWVLKIWWIKKKKSSHLRCRCSLILWKLQSSEPPK